MVPGPLGTVHNFQPGLGVSYRFLKNGDGREMAVIPLVPVFTSIPYRHEFGAHTRKVNGTSSWSLRRIEYGEYGHQLRDSPGGLTSDGGRFFRPES